MDRRVAPAPPPARVVAPAPPPARVVAPEERFEQLRLGESIEATDDELQAYVTTLLDRGGHPPAEPAWLREAFQRAPAADAAEDAAEA